MAECFMGTAAPWEAWRSLCDIRKEFDSLHASRYIDGEERCEKSPKNSGTEKCVGIFRFQCLKVNFKLVLIIRLIFLKVQKSDETLQLASKIRTVSVRKLQICLKFLFFQTRTLNF